MEIGLIGLGKMGGNMATRLCRGGVRVVGFDRSPEVVGALAQRAGLIAAGSLEDLLEKLPSPRVLWLMLPSGAVTEAQIQTLLPLLQKGDVIVDGGNSNYHDSERRAALLATHGLGFADAGTSGGVWGLENGYCLMVGATATVFEQIAPFLRVLAPAPDRGWAHVGPVGAGHFVKMIHNGIEYGMMQSLAEGLSLLQGKQSFALDLAQITHLWREGSVVRSWLLDLTAHGLSADPTLHHVAPYVADSGEGRWSAIEAIDQGLATPVLSLALQMRFQSQDQTGFGFKLLSMMRNAFGGHATRELP